MKSKVLHFTPRFDRDADKNIRDFIHLCRHELTAFGTGLDWGATEWPGVRFTKLGHSRKRDQLDKYELDPRFIDFAKAYFRYQQALKPTETKNESKALKAIEAVISSRPALIGVQDIDISLLDEAAQLVGAHYSKMAAYHAGREIQRFAKFVSEKKFTRATLSSWKSPIGKPRELAIQVGGIARRQQEKKLPSEQCLNALAEIFFNNSGSPRDVFTTSAWALLLCAPSRVSEILLLPVDCEVEETDRKGVQRYGWRFYSGKGYEGDIKWIPEVMVPVAREAVRRIRELTTPGRELASWIETYPDRFYRHADCPDLSEDSPLAPKEVAAALGVKDVLGARLSSKSGVYTLADLWQRELHALPADFPWACRKRRLKYSQALFCMRAHELHESLSASPIRLWMPNANDLNNDLSPRQGLVRSHKSIFDRYGYFEESGARLKVTSHQARHLLNTIANRGGLSNELIAKWSGRLELKQNRVYNHMSEFEMADKAERLGFQAKFASGDLATLHRPIAPDDLDRVERGAFHWTEYGVCTHDYTMSPCERFRDCLGCPEQVCIKGDEVREKRIREALAQVERDLNESSCAMAGAYAGSDRWVAAHLRRAENLRRLVQMLDDPAVPVGAQIRQVTLAGHSNLGRVVIDSSKRLVATRGVESGDAEFPSDG